MIGSSLVVVVDNCQHVLDGVATTIETLLQQCPGVRVIATSREALGLRGEVVRQVPSLDDTTAFELFVQRARSVRPTFDPSAEEGAAIVEIVMRLDGIPLAIELAAARVRMMSPSHIAAGIGDRLRLLSGGSRTAMSRQQTLEASIAWSYDLLGADEQQLARRLSVMHGFTLEAAEELSSDGLADRYGVLDILTRLIDKSMVPSPSTPTSSARWSSPTGPLATSLHFGWQLRWRCSGSCAVTSAAVDGGWPGCSTSTTWNRASPRARACWAAAHIGLHAGDLATMSVRAPEALELADRFDDDWTRARALNTLGFATAVTTPHQARPLLERSIELGSSSGDQWAVLSSHKMLTVLCWVTGDRSALFGAFVETAGFLGYRRFDGPSPFLDVAAGRGTELFAVDDRLSGWRVGVGDDPSVPVRLAEPLGEGSGLVAHDAAGAVVAIYRDPIDGPARLDVYDDATLRPVSQALVADQTTSMAISPGGTYVAVGGGTDGAVDLIRVSDGVTVGSLDAPRESPWRPVQSAAVAIGPDDVLYVAGLDYSVRRYQLPTMAPIEPLESTDTFPTTSGLLLINDGTTLIGHGWAEAPATHSVVARWNVGTGTLEWQGTTRLPCQDLAHLADEATLACTSSFGLVELLSVENGTPVGTAETQQDRVSAIAALSDGRRSVTASAAGPTVGLWDTAGSNPIVVVETESSRYNTPLWYSPDGRHVIGVAVPHSPFDVSEDGACSYVQEGCFLTPDLIDGETGAVVDSLDGILGAAWFGDGLAYVASDGSLGLLDVANGASQPVDASSLSILGEVVDYDPVHQRFFYWVDDGTSYLMDASRRRFVRSEIPATPTIPRAASFTGDGKRLAMVSNGELSLVDVDSGELLAGPLPGFDSVDAQGDLVVAGDRSGRVHVLDARSLDPVRTPMSSGSGVVQEIEVSSGLDVVMARSGDAVRLFDLGAGEQLGAAIAVPRADNAEGAALRPDGKRLAVTADAGFAIWNLDPSDWYRGACQLAGRSLTRDEWDAHIGGLAPYRATCDERS